MKPIESRWDADNHDFRSEVLQQGLELVRVHVAKVVSGLPASSILSRDDLQSAGVIGLLKAIDRFDPARGFKFATYASVLVRGEIMEELRSFDWAPRSLRRKLRELDGVAERLFAEKLGSVEVSDIAEEMGITEEKYHELLAEKSAVMIEWLEDVTEGSDYPDMADDREHFEDPSQLLCRQADRQALHEAVLRLSDRERELVRLYYYDGWTLKEIGEAWGVTESRVCQIKAVVSQKLARWIKQEAKSNDPAWLATRLDTKRQVEVTAPDRFRARALAGEFLGVEARKVSAKTIRIRRVSGS